MPITTTYTPPGPHMESSALIVRCNACSQILSSGQPLQPNRFLSRAAAQATAKDRHWFVYQDSVYCPRCIALGTNRNSNPKDLII